MVFLLFLMVVMVEIMVQAQEEDQERLTELRAVQVARVLMGFV